MCRCLTIAASVLVLLSGCANPKMSMEMPKKPTPGPEMAKLAVLLGVSSAWGQQILEETSTRFPIPNPAEYTNQLTIGDLDGDTDLDIVFANGGKASRIRIPIRLFTGNPVERAASLFA